MSNQIKSMTGYGKAEALLPAGKLTVEIRTLNSKSADINIKTPLLPKDKDIAARKKIADSLTRGTIDFFLTWEPNAGESAKPINGELVQSYLEQVRSLLPDACTPQSEAILLAAILRIPDVVETRKADVITEENWPAVDQAIDEALERLNAYRRHEGEALYRDVTSRVRRILDLYDQVEALEEERIKTIKDRILKNLEDLRQKPDPNRFEQELVFYLEKYDINEEKVRLRQHCKYFMDTIDGEPCPGKKLGFIIQEMGREINTTGSKANHAEIQKLVVQMKDELEKIREQSMNIL